MPDRSIVHGPAARAALLRGMARMTGLLRPTLGPTPRTVAIARVDGPGPPEVLDSAATIARRTIQLGDPFEDMGGMIIRHLVGQVFERAGDGTATAAVLAQALTRRAEQYVTAGSNPVAVARGIRRGLPAALTALRCQARPIELPVEIAGVVAGIVRDAELAEMIGEIVDSVGPDGAILVEDAQGIVTGYEYVDGVRWSEGYASPFLLRAGETTARLLNPRIFVTDHHLEKAEQLLPALEACIAAGDRNLLVVAPEVRESAVALLVVNRERGMLDGAIAVRAPSSGAQQIGILEDIAVITGGRCVHRDRHERLEDLTPNDLGSARQAWATGSAFGILGGQGDRAAIRRRIGEVRGELSALGDDPSTCEKIRERIGKLAGTAAVIRVGAATDSERAELKTRVEAAVTTARSALGQGVVPGGGAALLACVPALDAIDASGDEAAGLAALAWALAEPMRAIARNAGLDEGPIVHEARQRGPGWTFDVVRGAWSDVRDGGIVDSLPVVSTALETSVSAAATAIGADVLIHRKKAPMAAVP